MPNVRLHRLLDEAQISDMSADEYARFARNNRPATRTCVKCQQEKPSSEFYSWHAKSCKACDNIRWQNWKQRTQYQRKKAS